MRLFYRIIEISLTEQQHAQCASAHTLRVVIMEAVTRLEWLGRCACAQREVQLALRNNYDISAAPQILFIYMAAAPSTACSLIIRFGRRRRQQTLLMCSCYSEVWYATYCIKLKSIG